MIPEISLDAHWRCEYRQDAPDSSLDGFDVATLAAFEPRRIQGKMAFLERDFDLPLQDVCINYHLRVEAAPLGTHLSINGHDFGEVVAPLELDVTDVVALEDNTVRLRVAHNAFGAFRDMRLITIPCE